jgi:hypothetical protein
MDRCLLICQYKLALTEVIAHHITFRFPDSAPPPAVREALVVGHRFDTERGIECLVVEIDGESARPNGGTFHITFSLDRDRGAKPVHSNTILKSGWERLKTSISIKVEPKLVSTS